VVEEAVDHRRGDDFVAGHLAPDGEGLVRGDDQRGALIAGGLAAAAAAAANGREPTSSRPSGGI
jgi:hypothetical protein